MTQDISTADKSTVKTNLFQIVATSIACLVAGSTLGGIGGLLLGWFLGLGYHKRGPSDPADAPAYVAMGLTLAGASVGAIAGLLIGTIYTVRSARRKHRNSKDESTSR